MCPASMVLSTLVILPSLLLLAYFIVRPRPVRVPIKDRHVFITGGSSGIGLSIAKRAASEGARVSIMARNLDKLKQAKQSILLATGAEVSIFSADARDYEAVQRAVNDAGPIEILVVSHGVYEHDELERQDLDVVKYMLDVNLIGSFSVIKAALPQMKHRKDKRPASISLMVSQAAQVGIYGYTAYSASNFGLRGLAQALQQEVIADDIHVSLVFPPDTETPSFKQAKRSMPEITRIIIGSPVPMKADEVANITLDGIKSGRSIIPCNLLGYILAIATADLSMPRSFFMASIEVVFAGIFRFIGLYYLWSAYRKIENWHSHKQ
ncbi:hypothetical protein DITRI_Ditri15bG0020400 [Diplodiscus trichospermus]